MKKIFQLAIMACTALSVHATDYTRGFSIWFDTPNTLVNKAVWFGNTPAMPLILSVIFFSPHFSHML